MVDLAGIDQVIARFNTRNSAAMAAWFVVIE
jgi:hypothetical protein